MTSFHFRNGFSAFSDFRTLLNLDFGLYSETTRQPNQQKEEQSPKAHPANSHRRRRLAVSSALPGGSLPPGRQQSQMQPKQKRLSQAKGGLKKNAKANLLRKTGLLSATHMDAPPR
jgi:hypothetical protein